MRGSAHALRKGQLGTQGATENGAADCRGPPSAPAGAPIATSASTSTRTATPSAPARRAARKRAPARSTSPAALPTGLSIGALGVATPAGTGESSKHATSKHTSQGPLGAAPIVRTITQIVDVVPLPLRLVIGMLMLLVLATAVRSRLTARRARRLEVQRKQLLDDVGLLQAALLPEPPARLGPVATSAAYRPADGPGAGGTSTTCLRSTDGQLAVIVGDVAGHGRELAPAHGARALHAARVPGGRPLAARCGADSGCGARAPAEGSIDDGYRRDLQPRKRLLAYASAGHPPPIVLGQTSMAAITAASSPPLGAGVRTGSRQTVVSVPGRSQICFYTDGVTESRVRSELFGSTRLAHAVAELGPSETASDLLERVASTTDDVPDDMAACLLSIDGGGGRPAFSSRSSSSTARSDDERDERFLLECGVEPRGVGELMRSARAAAGPVGTVLLEVRPSEGSRPSLAAQR